MSREKDALYYDFEKPLTLLKWKVLPGSRFSMGTVLFVYRSNPENAVEKDSMLYLKFKSNCEGTVKRLLVKEGDSIERGSKILLLEASCSHSIVMKDMCAECGTDLRELEGKELAEVAAVTSVSMIHSIPELRISAKKAQELGKADEERLLNSRKLVLLVDLDQTLIHTTNENVPPNMKGVYHFQLYGSNSPWYHTKFRPGTAEFLTRVSNLYELHIFTFGARPYAHHIACLLDKEGKHFSHRILSRDECLSQSTKTGNLKALFPCGDSMVCIIDDREDVWSYAPNLVHVKPYHFFSGTGDINEPLEKYPLSAKSDPTNSGSEDRSRISAVKEKMETTTLEEEELMSSLIFNNLDPEAGKATFSNGNPTKGCITEPFHQTLEVMTALQLREGISVEAEDSPKNEEGIMETANNAFPAEADACPILLQSMVKDQVRDAKEHKSDLSDQVTRIEANERLQMTTLIEKQATFSVSTIDVSFEGLKTICRQYSTNQERAEKEVSNPELSTEPNNGVKERIVPKHKSDSESLGSSGSERAMDDSSLDSSVALEEDDYLLYLEEILGNIHAAFYEMYDQIQDKKVNQMPDLKSVIPYVRRKVLKNVNIVFSGVIPTNLDPQKHKLWIVAKSLGANITRELLPLNPSGTGTTHLVAAALGTAKVIKAMRMKGVHVVNTDWLLNCSERWEKVDERLFPLTAERNLLKANMKSHSDDLRDPSWRPLSMCRAGDSVEAGPTQIPVYNQLTGKRVRAGVTNSLEGHLSGEASAGERENRKRRKAETRPKEVEKEEEASFCNSYSPLYSFSPDDLTKMGQEVADACSEDSEEDDSSSSSSSENKTGRLGSSFSDRTSWTLGEPPRGGWKKRKKREERRATRTGMDDSDEEGRLLSKGFSSGSLKNENSESDELNDSLGSVDEEMAAAVEREFLN